MVKTIYKGNRLSIEERVYALEHSISPISKRCDMNISVFKSEIKELVKMGVLTTCIRADLHNKRYLQTKSRATKKNQQEKKRKERLAKQEILNLQKIKKQLRVEKINLHLQIEEIIFNIEVCDSIPDRNFNH